MKTFKQEAQQDASEAAWPSPQSARDAVEHDCNDLDSPACEECCEHQDRDGTECLDCGKDLTDMLTRQAEDYYECRMEVYGQAEND